MSHLSICSSGCFLFVCFLFWNLCWFYIGSYFSCSGSWLLFQLICWFFHDLFVGGCCILFVSCKTGKVCLFDFSPQPSVPHVYGCCTLYKYLCLNPMFLVWWSIQFSLLFSDVGNWLCLHVSWLRYVTCCLVGLEFVSLW